jgi:hypothetical protein
MCRRRHVWMRSGCISLRQPPVCTAELAIERVRPWFHRSGLRPQHQAVTVGVMIGLVGEELDRDELAELDRPALDVLDWLYRQRERGRRPPPLTEGEAP